MSARGACPRLTTGLLVATNCLLGASAASLVTVQNSTVSIPAASIAAAGLPGVTNLAGSNFLLSAVMPGTFQGGRASLKNSQQWVRRYAGAPTSSQNGVSAMAVRRDGSVVVTGYSSGTGTGNDLATICYSPDGTPEWTNRYDGPGHGDDTGAFLAADPGGNVWVVGSSMRYATNSKLTDVITIKYASNGVPIWTNRYSSFETNSPYPTALAVDSEGNAYVEQWATYWPSDSSLGKPVEDAIIKYDALGNVEWIKQNFSSLHQFGPMGLDAMGNLIVAGTSGGGLFGDSVVKFMGNGTAIWTNHFSSQTMPDLDLISVDREGNTIVTGSRWNNNMTIYVALKITQSGDLVWTNESPGPGYNGGNVPQTAVDPAGNVFVIGGTPSSSPGSYRILKISSDGIPLWTNQHADLGTTGSMIYGSAVDNAGNLYMTGYAPAPNGYADIVTMKFSGAGQALWTNRFNGAANRDDYVSALAVSSVGDVYIAGQSEWTAGKREYATIKHADSLSYSPPKDFTGLDSITAVLTDYLGNSATGTVEVLIVPGAFRFSLVAPATGMTPAGMRLRVEGVPGTNAVVLEASVDAMSWQRISTNAPNDGVVQFLDPSAISLASRFYRVIQEQ